MEQAKYGSLNFWGKTAVRHAHPASFVFNILGLLWAGYFLWIHRWPWALLCFFGLVLGGILWGALDKSYLLQARSELNTFQKLLVYHTHPANLVFHLVALSLYVLGTWRHSPVFLIGAISFILLGHISPWLYHRRKEQLFALMIDEDISLADEDRND
jgi:hypothetical protein